MTTPLPTVTTRARRSARPAAAVAAALLGLGTLAACGSDDDKSTQERYCEAGEGLESSVTALLDLDLIAEGTNGLEGAINDVQDDVNTLVETADDASSDESAALDQSLNDLESAFEGLAGEITADNVTALSTAIQDVATSAQAVYETLTDC